MLPLFYHNILKKYLNPKQLLTLNMLVWLLQSQKQVRIERLAATLPLTILQNSRRRHIQRFLLIKGKDSGLKTCGSNACLARVLGQNKGFCLSWLIVNKRGEVTVFRGLLRIEIDLVSSSISKVFAQQGVQ